MRNFARLISSKRAAEILKIIFTFISALCWLEIQHKLYFHCRSFHHAYWEWDFSHAYLQYSNQVTQATLKWMLRSTVLEFIQGIQDFDNSIIKENIEYILLISLLNHSIISCNVVMASKVILHNSCYLTTRRGFIARIYDWKTGSLLRTVEAEDPPKFT